MDRLKKILDMKVLYVLTLCVGIIGSCSLMNKQAGLEDDNPIEELVEELINLKTGIYIDLTPESDE